MLRHEMGELRTTLPGHDYRSTEVYELDRERVFFREWMYVARADEAPEPGDFVTVDVAGESVVVVRDQDEELRAVLQRLPASRLAHLRRGDPRARKRGDQVPVPRVVVLLRRKAHRNATRSGRTSSTARRSACGRCASRSGRATCS